MTTIEQALRDLLFALAQKRKVSGLDSIRGAEATIALKVQAARAALAAHEAQQPVAWRYRYHRNGEWHLAEESARARMAMAGAGGTFEEQPLYTRGTK